MSLIFLCVKLVEYSSSSLMSWLIRILDTINRFHVFSIENLANFCKVPGTKYLCGPCGLTANIPLCCCGSRGHLQMSKHGGAPTWLFMAAEIWIYISFKCHKILFFLSFSSIWKYKNHSWIVGHTEMDRIRPPSHSLPLPTAAGFLNMIYLVETYFPYLVGNRHLD